MSQQDERAKAIWNASIKMLGANFQLFSWQGGDAPPLAEAILAYAKQSGSPVDPDEIEKVFDLMREARHEMMKALFMGAKLIDVTITSKKTQEPTP